MTILPRGGRGARSTSRRARLGHGLLVGGSLGTDDDLPGVSDLDLGCVYVDRATLLDREAPHPT